jgi:hypothetical protein
MDGDGVSLLPKIQPQKNSPAQLWSAPNVSITSMRQESQQQKQQQLKKSGIVIH